MNIITISREFGSGGRTIGRALAETLGYKYYDKEIIQEIAKQVNLSEEEVMKLSEENKATFLQMPFENYTGMARRSVDVLRAQRQVLLQIAEKNENCVIIGRSGGAILGDEHPLRLFIYADTQTKLDNIRATQEKYANSTDKQIIRTMKRIDSIRAAYFELVSGEQWGDRNNYDLCINTSGCAMKNLVKPIADYAVSWFED